MAGVPLRIPFQFTVTDTTFVVPFILIPGNDKRLNIKLIHLSTFDSGGNKGAVNIQHCFFSSEGTGYTTDSASLVLEDSQYSGTVDAVVKTGGSVAPSVDRIIGYSLIAANNVSSIFSALNERDGLNVPGGNSSGTGKHKFGFKCNRPSGSGDIDIAGYIALEY